MRLAIFGATSQIAKDLVLSTAIQSSYELVLYARRPDVVLQWLSGVGLAHRHKVHSLSDFSVVDTFDAILNFIGVGDPAQAGSMGASIFDITQQYDDIALNYLRQHPMCRYIFLSSGAAYGSNFEEPAALNSKAVFNINDIQPQDWYGITKMHAECRHRSLAHLSIMDIRVFNYFSHTQDMDARFLMTDIIRAIRNDSVLKTSSDYIVRDFLHPSDFSQLVDLLLRDSLTNAAIDCYSKAPVEKSNLLTVMQEKFGLRFEVTETHTGVNTTGSKRHYYSINKYASHFGYDPVWTSLDGVISEVELYMRMMNHNE